jgi:hypothetical protein
MPVDLLEQLEALPPAVLTEVVRTDQHDPGLELLDWTVRPLKPENVGLSSGSLYRFSGHSRGAGSLRPWAVVLKCIHHPAGESPPQHDWAYLQREILAFQSGMLASLPPGLRAPRFYGVIEQAQAAWVWLEYIDDAQPRQWPLAVFQQAARQLGRFGAAYLRAAPTPIPEYPWLCRQPVVRSIWAAHSWWTGFMHPSAPGCAWASPSTQRAFDERTQARVLRLLAEKERFFAVNDRLPQVLCHNDAHRRNFMWSRSAQGGENELVAIDWAMTGPGALGNDLGKLLENSMLLFDYDPFDAKTLTAAGYQAYLEGIAAAGAQVDPRLVRLGQLISAAFWIAAAGPGWAALMLAPESGNDIPAMYGRTAEEALAGWAALTRFCLDGADEARSLIRELGL